MNQQLLRWRQAVGAVMAITALWMNLVHVVARVNGPRRREAVVKATDAKGAVMPRGTLA